MVEGTKEASKRHWVRWLTLGGSVSLLLLVGASCAYDKDNRCGDDLVFDEENEVCVCPVGTLYSPTGCTACGEHEILQGAECVCEEGYAEGADGTCEEIPGGAGGEGGEGNSTTGPTPECTVNDDCEAGEICEAEACTPVTGFGAACTEQDQCADFEASYCDTYQSKCTISDCTVAPDSCPSAYDCCDLSLFGFAIMCIPEGGCPAP